MDKKLKMNILFVVAEYLMTEGDTEYAYCGKNIRYSLIKK
tara:strand:+ start:1533 stop:1652 length:120 start_codon:yes stop_codon:yes gene_type:complete